MKNIFLSLILILIVNVSIKAVEIDEIKHLRQQISIKTTENLWYILNMFQQKKNLLLNDNDMISQLLISSELIELAKKFKDFYSKHNQNITDLDTLITLSRINNHMVIIVNK